MSNESPEIELDAFLEFLREYELICRKFGMKATADGDSVYAENVEQISSDEIDQYIAGLKDEGFENWTVQSTKIASKTQGERDA